MGNRQGAPGWGGQTPRDLRLREQITPYGKGDKIAGTFAPRHLNHAAGYGTRQPERGGPRAWGSQSLEVAAPFLPSPPPLRRTPAPYLLRCRSPPLRSAGAPPPAAHGAGAARPSAAPGRRALPRPPAPAGRPRPPHAPQPLSQGRSGLRSRHSRGGAGGAGKEGGEGTGRVGSALWRPSFGVEPPFLSSGCTCLSPDPLASMGIQAGAALGRTELGAEGAGQGPNFGVGDALTHPDTGRVRQGSQRRFREPASALFLADSLPSCKAEQSSIPSTLPAPEEIWHHRDVASSHWERSLVPAHFPKTAHPALPPICNKPPTAPLAPTAPERPHQDQSVVAGVLLFINPN